MARATMRVLGYEPGSSAGTARNHRAVLQPLFILFLTHWLLLPSRVSGRVVSARSRRCSCPSLVGLLLVPSVTRDLWGLMAASLQILHLV